MSMAVLSVKVLWPVRLDKKSWILFTHTFQQVSGFYPKSGLFPVGFSQFCEICIRGVNN